MPLLRTSLTAILSSSLILGWVIAAGNVSKVGDSSASTQNAEVGEDGINRSELSPEEAAMLEEAEATAAEGAITYVPTVTPPEMMLSAEELEELFSDAQPIPREDEVFDPDAEDEEPDVMLDDTVLEDTPAPPWADEPLTEDNSDVWDDETAPAVLAWRAEAPGR